MTSSLSHLLFFCSLVLISASSAETSFRPKALLVPVRKDVSTLQYLTTINQDVKLVLHLGGQYMWVDCDRNYLSSSYLPVHCRSAQCSLARSDGCGYCFADPRPGCHNRCQVSPDNPVTGSCTSGGLAQDVVSVESTDGTNPGRVVSVSNFIFSCAQTFFLDGLAAGAVGMAGLGRSKIGLPSQLASAFSFHLKFAICLPPSTAEDGVVFFGGGPYRFLLTDASQSLIYTPLYTNPVSTTIGESPDDGPSVEYFIGVKSIKIGEKAVKLNTTLLSIDGEGVGGTKISTVNPYTVMETSIYRAFTKAFISAAAAMNISRAAAVAPFGACFSSKNVGSTQAGPAVPNIDLVLQEESLYWRVFGANSMVQVSDDALCLGFVDGGVYTRSSIVIGGKQLEDNLLEFDIATSKLGFSSSLLFRRTRCADFNFTASP